MSYDLMVFEKSKAPTTKQEFMAWYEKQTEWNEEHGYLMPSVASPALQEWYTEMTKTFPSMNGDDTPAPDFLDKDEDLERHVTDYSIGCDIIYAAFSWSLVDEAYELTKRLAQQHEVGFFDVSGADGNIILPDGTMME